VFGAGDGRYTGNYSFRLIEAPDQIFNISVGSTVTNGVPAAGAGVLGIPGEVDIYRLKVVAGQQLYFQELTPDISINWTLYDTNNTPIFVERINGDSPSRVTIQKSGTYEARVFGAGDSHYT